MAVEKVFLVETDRVSMTTFQTEWTKRTTVKERSVPGVEKELRLVGHTGYGMRVETMFGIRSRGPGPDHGQSGNMNGSV